MSLQFYLSHKLLNFVNNYEGNAHTKFCRYTYRPDTGAVYGTQTQLYQSTVVIGAVKTNYNLKISLLGYGGELVWKPAANNTIKISMPDLPLDSELRWAWVFKFENIAPVTKQ